MIRGRLPRHLMANESPQLQPLFDSPRPPAGFMVRFGALMLDCLVIGAAQALLAFALEALQVPPGAVSLLSAVAAAAYFSLLPAFWGGQTLGKRAAGVAVLRLDGGPLSAGRACGRYFAYFLSLFPLGAGFLAALFRKDRRSLHDLIVGTTVLQVEPLPAWRRNLVSGAGIALLSAAALLAVAMRSDMQQEQSAGPATPGSPAQEPSAEEEEAEPEEEDSAQAALDLLRERLEDKVSDGEAYPATLDPSEIEDFPELKLPDHPPSSSVQAYGAQACAGQGISRAALKDTGSWGYVGAEGASCRGHVFIDCTHLDPDGKPWFER